MTQYLSQVIYKHENKHKQKVSSKYPLVIRFDAKGTSNNNIDVLSDEYRRAMWKTSSYLMSLIGGENRSKNHILSYIQSDEINILAVPNNSIVRFISQHKNDVQKLISTLSAEIAIEFNKHYRKDTVIFDVKVFNIPNKLLQGYLIWRQKSSLNFTYFYQAKKVLTYEERIHQNQEDLYKKMKLKGFDMNAYPNEYKYGFLVHKSLAYEFPPFKFNQVNNVSFARLIKNSKGNIIKI